MIIAPCARCRGLKISSKIFIHFTLPCTIYSIFIHEFWSKSFQDLRKIMQLRSGTQLPKEIRGLKPCDEQLKHMYQYHHHRCIMQRDPYSHGGTVERSLPSTHNSFLDYALGFSIPLPNPNLCISQNLHNFSGQISKYTQY